MRKTLVWILGAVFLCMGSSSLLPQSFAQAQDDEGPWARPTEELPVNVEIEADELEKLDPNQRVLLEEIKAKLEKQLFRLSDPKFEKPVSLFPEGQGELLQWSDLVPPTPDDSELTELAQAHRRFSAGQLAQIREEGVFVVESVRYPGQFHVWKVTALVQKGARAIGLTWKKHHDSGKHLLTVTVPDVLFRGRGVFTARRGLKNIAEGLSQAWGLVVGRSETYPRYDHETANSLVSKEIETLAANEMAADSTQPRTRILTLDHALMQSAEAPLQRVLSELEEEWRKNRDELRITFAKRWKTEGDSSLREDAEALAYFTDVFEDTEKTEFVIKGLASAPELLALHPELGSAIGRKIRALRIVMPREEKFLASLYDDFASQHPEELESYLAGKKTKAFEAKFKAFWEARLPAHFAGIVQALERVELMDEAAQFEALTRLATIHYAKRMAETEALRDPDRTFEFEAPIWRRSEWKVEKDSNGEYQLVTAHKKSVPTVGPWRLELFFERFRNTPSVFLYHAWVDGFWNGPLGIKALMLSKPFVRVPAIDTTTGTFLSPEDPRFRQSGGILGGTMLQQIRNQYAIRARLLENFELQTRTGIFGRHFERAVLGLKADVWHGFLAPALIGVVQPALTVANLGFRVAESAIGVPLIPVVMPLMWMTSVGVYDFDRPNRTSPRVLPIFQALLVKTGLCGIGQCVAPAAVATAAAIGGVGHYTVGAIKTAINTAWDRLMSLPLRLWGRVPNSDTRGFVARTQGPDLSDNYGYKISVELATLLAWTVIERKHLEAYRDAWSDEIHRPIERIEYLETTLQPLFGEGAFRDYFPAAADIQNEIDKRIKLLDAFVNELRDSKGVQHRDYRRDRRYLDIRGGHKDELNFALSRVFFTRAELDQLKARLRGLMTEHPVGKVIAARALARALSAEDQKRGHEALIEYAIEYGIGEDALVSREELAPTGQGKGLILNVQNPPLLSMFDDILTGTAHPAAPVTTVTIPATETSGAEPQPSEKKRKYPNHRIINPRQLCAEMFLDMRRIEPSLYDAHTALYLRTRQSQMR